MLLLFAGLVRVGRTAERAAGLRSPDIVIILCDQLSARVLGCYGGPVPTPNIDRIAHEGVLFRNASCTFPVCSPSRATLATGLYPHSHGITYNVMRRDYPMVPSPATQEGLKAADVTTESILYRAGYATHFYGKWHLTDEDLPYYSDMFTEHDAYAREMALEFETVRGTDRSSWMNWYEWALPVRQTSTFFKAARQASIGWQGKPYLDFVTKMGRLDLPLAKTFDVRVADKTVECIKRAGPAPLMVTCSFNAPHDPNVVTSPYYEMFNPAAILLPENGDVREAWHEKSWSRQMVVGLGEPGLREFLRIYYASVRMIDDQVGRILTALEEAGRLDRTAIVFAADHGDMVGGHGMAWKSNSSFYDEIVLVPFLIRYPPLFRPQICDLDTGLIDLMPTLLEIAHQPCPTTSQGQSLVPFLTGTKPASEARQFSFSERVPANPHNTRQHGARPGASFMVRGQGWKYIRYANGSQVLYDLRQDPGETVNRIDDQTCVERSETMVVALQKWLEQTGWHP
jgi:arylsulfatase A-like enzyme